MTPEEFLKTIWTDKGAAWLAAISPETGKHRGLRIEYPQELHEVKPFLKDNQFRNLYACVNLTDHKDARAAADVSRSKVIYADLDDKCRPQDLLVRPSIVLRTSPRKTQAFWILERTVDANDTSEISRRIASHHRLDACWDKVRLMRIPGTCNYKYDDPFEVSVEYNGSALFRLSDFKVYPEVKLRYIDHRYNTPNIADVPKYEDLDVEEQERIDRYTERAIEYEILKLDELANLDDGEKLEYHGMNGYQEFGWERGTMWVARCLVELANSPWNSYTLEQARKDFMTNAPTDLNWTNNENYAKWQGAINSNLHREFRYRRYPDEWGL